MKIVLAASKGFQEKSLNLAYEKSSYQIKCEKTTKLLLKQLKSKSIEEFSLKMKIKNDLLIKTFELYHSRKKFTEVEAISYYNGVVFKQITNVLDHQEYVNKNVILISALYGLLKPFDKIKPYRLDFNMSFFDKSLYKYWENISDLIDDEIIVNLASVEYSKVINKKMLNIHFIQYKNGVARNISAFTKKARGLFCNYMIINEIEDIKALINFCDDEYLFDSFISDDNNYYFSKNID